MKTATMPVVTEKQWKEVYKKGRKSIARKFKLPMEEVDKLIAAESKEDKTWEDKHMSLCLVYDILLGNLG